MLVTTEASAALMLLDNEMSRMCYNIATTTEEQDAHRSVVRTRTSFADSFALGFVQATDAWKLSHVRHIN